MERSGTWWAPRAFCSVEFSKRDDLRIAATKKTAPGAVERLERLECTRVLRGQNG